MLNGFRWKVQLVIPDNRKGKIILFTRRKVPVVILRPVLPSDRFLASIQSSSQHQCTDHSLWDSETTDEIVCLQWDRLWLIYGFRNHKLSWLQQHALERRFHLLDDSPDHCELKQHSLRNYDKSWPLPCNLTLSYPPECLWYILRNFYQIFGKKIADTAPDSRYHRHYRNWNCHMTDRVLQCSEWEW